MNRRTMLKLIQQHNFVSFEDVHEYLNKNHVVFHRNKEDKSTDVLLKMNDD